MAQQPTPYQRLPGSLAVTFLQSVFEVTQRAGIEQQRLVTAAGLEPSLLQDQSQRISGDAYCQLLDTAASLCHDNDLGLHVGEAIKPGHYGVLGYACMSSSTVAEMIQRMLRYQSLVSDIGINRITAEGDNLKLQFICDVSPYPPRHLVEEHLAGMVVFSRWLSSNQQSPNAVRFQHPQPDNIQEHQRIFNCPLFFGQTESAVLFPASAISLQLPQADPALSQLMDSYAEQQLATLPEGDGLLKEAHQALAELLKGGEPTLERLADKLGLSARSLQRSLKDEGLTYLELLDRIRRQLALSYIRQGHLSLTDIAFLLGFAEQSSFQRAFKRWTGETPGRYRRMR